MAFNFFDFQKPSPATSFRNDIATGRFTVDRLGADMGLVTPQPLSSAMPQQAMTGGGTTSIGDRNPVTYDRPRQESTSTGFSFPDIVPTANAAGTSEEPDLIQSYLDDTSVSRQNRETVFSMLEDGVPRDQIEAAISSVYGTPKEESPGFFSKVGTSIMKRGEDIAASTERQVRGEQTGAESVLQLGGSIAGGIGDIVGAAVSSAYSSLGSPGIDKVKAILDTEAGKAGMEAIGKGMEAYGSWAKENPREAANLESVVNIASLLPIGKGAKAAGEGVEAVGKAGAKAGKAVGKLAAKAPTAAGEAAVSIGTGISKEAQQAIKSTPSLYKAARTGNITRESIFDTAKAAIDKRMEDLSTLGRSYKDLRKGATVATKDEIDNAFLKATEKLNTIDLPKADRVALKEVSDYLGELKGNITDERLLALRKKVDSTISWDKGVSSEGQAAVRSIRSELDKFAKERIPGLAERDLRFAPEKQFLDKIKKTIYNSDGSVKDNAISSVSNLLGKGKEFKLENFEKVMPGITDQIKALKAYEEVQSILSVKTGSIARQLGGIGAGTAAGGPLGAIVGFIASNPYVAARLLETYGFTKAGIKNLIAKKAKPATMEKAVETFRKVKPKQLEKILISPVKKKVTK